MHEDLSMHGSGVKTRIEQEGPITTCRDMEEEECRAPDDWKGQIWRTCWARGSVSSCVRRSTRLDRIAMANKGWRCKFKDVFRGRARRQ